MFGHYSRAAEVVRLASGSWRAKRTSAFTSSLKVFVFSLCASL